MLEDVLLSGEDEKSTLLIHIAACSYCRARVRKLPVAVRRQIAAVVPTLVDLPAADRLGESADPAGFYACQATAYSSVIERSERKYLERARDMQRERTRAPQLLDELLTHEPRKRRLVLGNARRFHTWGVYEATLDRSWNLRVSHSHQAEDLAHLALELADYLDTSYYSPELIEDLRARAWSYIGNLRRMASDLDGADRAFETSYSHLKKGTREPIERAMFLDLKASLRRAQRHLDEAMRLLNRAASIFLRQGDAQRAGRSLVNLSTVHELAGEIERAIAILQQAMQLIDPATDERLVLDASHNLIWYLASLGRFIEAQGVYRNTRPLYEKYEAAGFASRRRWVKGRIERGLGQVESAERLLLEARQGFLDKEIPYDAAVVSLDLAILYAEQKRTAELKQLASEALPIFTALGIQREALAALVFLKQAADTERLSVQMAARLADFVYRAQGDPSLKFEAPR